MLVSNKSAHNITSCTPFSKVSCTKTITVALLPTWIVYHDDSLILSDNCVSVASAISSICLVMVLAEKGTCATV